MTFGTNLTPPPPLNSDHKAPKKKRYCLTVSSVDPLKTNPLTPEADSKVWKDDERCVSVFVKKM
jgi:hypothetical protein